MFEMSLPDSLPPSLTPSLTPSGRYYKILCLHSEKHYNSAKNKDNDTKLSEYDPWGLPRSSMLSRMTLSSKFPIRNPQRPLSTPCS